MQPGSDKLIKCSPDFQLSTDERYLVAYTVAISIISLCFLLFRLLLQYVAQFQSRELVNFSVSCIVNWRSVAASNDKSA